MAVASVFVMELDKETYYQQIDPMQSLVSVGYRSDVTIAELAKAAGEVVGCQGKIAFDISKPDGVPRK
jgi:GDP-L-fucose synthase